MLHTGLIAPISELLERHRKQRPDKVAYWDAVRSVTYSQLANRTASIAAGLSAKGLREGDRIAIYLPNGVDWIEACLAGLRSGAVIVPISYDAAEAEIAYRLSDADCRTVITTPARKELIDKLAAGLNRSGFACFRRCRRREAGLCLDELAQSNQRQCRCRFEILMTSIAHRSSSTRLVRPAAPRACCCRSAECYGLRLRVGHRFAS
jgi:long-subunit acyl-CoA synthetase (AMP-forming)